MRFYLMENLLHDEIIVALAFMLGGFLLGRIVYGIFHGVFARIAKKTATELDDKVVDALKLPLSVIVMLIGLYLGLHNISALEPFKRWIAGSTWVVFAIVIAWLFRRLINTVLDWYAADVAHKTASKTDDHIFPMLRRIINIILYVIVFIMILDHFNVEISPLIASLGVASLAVALALQDTLSNFFAGMFIIADKPIRVGDFIQMENGEEGHVVNVGWRSTRVKKLSNNFVILPNSKLANSIITNYDLPQKQLSVITYCGVAYSSDLEKVEKVAHVVAVKTRDAFEGAIKDYDPLIRFYEFGDSNINFKIILRANSYVDRFKLQHELVKNLKKAFDKEGIEISWPVRKIIKG